MGSRPITQCDNCGASVDDFIKVFPYPDMPVFWNRVLRIEFADKALNYCCWPCFRSALPAHFNCHSLDENEQQGICVDLRTPVLIQRYWSPRTHCGVCCQRFRQFGMRYTARWTLVQDMQNNLSNIIVACSLACIGHARLLLNADSVNPLVPPDFRAVPKTVVRIDDTPSFEQLHSRDSNGTWEITRYFCRSNISSEAISYS